MKKSIIILIAVVLAGCATQPVSNRDALTITGDQLLDKRYSKRYKNSGRVIVKRDSGVFGIGCSFRIFVNGRPMADLEREEKVIFYLPPNEYIISAQSIGSFGICGIGDGYKEIEANVKTGKQLIYRVGATMNSGFFISRTAF